jgi:hypothetical protein
VTDVDAGKTDWRGLYAVSGAAALLVGVLTFIGGMYLITTGLQSSTTSGWLSLVGNNWLVVLLQRHAGINGVQLNQLYMLNLLDIGIMLLVAIAFLGLYAAVRSASKIWSIIALVQPFLGVVIFIATLSAGRSAVMGAVLVISLVILLRSTTFSTAVAYIGIPASVLLLVGDLSASIALSGIIAFFVGIGYVLLIIWFVLVGQRLIQLGRPESKGGYA